MKTLKFAKAHRAGTTFWSNDITTAVHLRRIPGGGIAVCGRPLYRRVGGNTYQSRNTSESLECQNCVRWLKELRCEIDSLVEEAEAHALEATA